MIRIDFTDKKDFVATQVGNPEGPDKPNKKYYDPRVSLWLRNRELFTDPFLGMGPRGREDNGHSCQGSHERSSVRFSIVICLASTQIARFSTENRL